MWYELVIFSNLCNEIDLQLCKKCYNNKNLSYAYDMFLPLLHYPGFYNI